MWLSKKRKPSKTRSPLQQRILETTAFGIVVTPAVWMGCWFGALGLQSLRDTFGYGDTAPKTAPVSKKLAAELRKNSTEIIFNHAHNAKLSSLSDQSIWSEMTPFRRSLASYSPDLDSWLNTLYQSGRLQFLNFSNDESHTTRLARFDFHTKSLLLLPGFFSQTDAQKILILRHERFHAGEDIIDLIVTHGAPLAGIGTLQSKVAHGMSSLVKNIGSLFIEPIPDEVRKNRLIQIEYYEDGSHPYATYPVTEMTLGQKIGNECFDIANNLAKEGEQGSTSYDLMYYNNRSERAARKCEEEARFKLDMTPEIIDKDSISIQATTSSFPEGGEIMLGFLIGAGSIKGSKKRLKNIKKIITDSKQKQK